MKSYQYIEVIPGIFEKDFPKIDKRTRLVAPFVDWIHIDIADKRLVPNSSLLDPAPFKKLIKETGKDFELHMMVEKPFTVAPSWIAAGFERLIMHIEALSNVTNLKDQMFRMKNKYEDLQIGLAVDKDTDVDSVFPYLDVIDCVLIMTIKAGFSGQQFVPDLIQKVKVLRDMKKYLPVEVDGGINDETAKLAIAAGATRIVSTSYVFSSENIGEALRNLKS